MSSRTDASPATVPRFYRPELDAIRFAAFLAVFIFHAPHVPLFDRLARAGSFGLPLFFFLSAFLITELLLREQQQTGTIHLKAFYIRRALRIWPLYFFSVFTAILWGHFDSRYHLTRHEIAYLLLLVLGFLGREFHMNPPAGILWSISVEEIFYLIWPISGKLRAFGWGCLALLVCATVTILSTDDVWYNPLSQFFYFALGALLALSIQHVRIILPLFFRLALLSLSIAAFLWGSTLSFGLLRFAVGGIGCALAIVAVLYIDSRLVPRPMTYLGKISYGLYLFHGSCIVLVTNLVDKFVPHFGMSRRAAVIQCLAMASCVALAALSYRYFETPFLKLKSRFEFVKSRPV